MTTSLNTEGERKYGVLWKQNLGNLFIVCLSAWLYHSCVFSPRFPVCCIGEAKSLTGLRLECNSVNNDDIPDSLPPTWAYRAWPFKHQVLHRESRSARYADYGPSGWVPAPSSGDFCFSAMSQSLILLAVSYDSLPTAAGRDRLNGIPWPYWDLNLSIIFLEL